jgi:transcriptional regulator with XRE-family HTH domain
MGRTRRRPTPPRRRPSRVRYSTFVEFLDATGLPQAQVAALAGTTQATISRIARGVLIPKAALAQRLAAVAHIPIESFAREYYARRFGPRKPSSAERVA